MYVLVITGVVAFIAIGKLSLGHYAAFIGAAERFRDSTMLSFGSLITLDHDLYIGDMLDYLQIQEKSLSGNVTKLNVEGINFRISFTVHPGEQLLW